MTVKLGKKVTKQDDPFVLTDSSVELSFCITDEGDISLGVDGSLSNELTHTLTLNLKPAQANASPR
jgi:hypothetical protein